MFLGNKSMRIEPSAAAELGRTWVAGTASMTDDVSTGSAEECRFDEAGTVLRSSVADWTRPSVPTSVADAEEVVEAGAVSLTLEFLLKSRDKRCLNPNFDERPEDTNLASLVSPGP